MKIVFCTPTMTRPHPAYLAALEAAVPAVEAAGIEHQAVYELGNPYISAARAAMTRKALDAGADAMIYIDHDVSFRPQDVVALAQAEGEVVAGTYRYKNDVAKEEYMGALLEGPDGRPVTRDDGAMVAHSVPAGFLKVTRNGIRKIMRAHPELLMGRREAPAVDLFHHGAYDFVWYGEDMAFCRRWRDMGETIWLLPDLDLDHWAGDLCFPGNFHRFMLRQPGGSEDPSRWVKALDVEPTGGQPTMGPADEQMTREQLGDIEVAGAAAGEELLRCVQCKTLTPAARTRNGRSSPFMGIYVCDTCYYDKAAGGVGSAA